jgi:hypothetical protein
MHFYNKTYQHFITNLFEKVGIEHTRIRYNLETALRQFFKGSDRNKVRRQVRYDGCRVN